MSTQAPLSDNTITPRWHLFQTANQLAEQATQDILDAARMAIADKGAFHIVLAGGTTPKVIYKLLAEAGSDWQHWHIYLGDERCLPANDPERNSVMATECLLDHVSIPQEHVHFMPTELGSEAAAASYRKTLEGVSSFDVVLLGMGEDGHTASLFPGHIHDLSDTVHAVSNSPKPPADRVSLSSECLSNNAKILILITGQSKHDRIIDWISGINMPITSITSNKSAAVYCDMAAWVGDS
ncbi:6-phosphogluconolactonase [Leucothrix arctica]|uniref:6-phosphogluconolactonase n=1 Tax=Leucothrix arctica TaxID=1481894 RepID=A0A317C7X0_9GAMM|nr:6-phosphogluconolactonase [Leucothrix arctica]PWQ93463.1 6-phosphogluconolactonase [Leucothrix arctica]